MVKKLFVALAAFAFLGTASAMAQAAISFKKTTHNFGKFKEEKPQTYDFVFTNTGDKPLIVNQAVASCGCTVPTFTKEPIKPGKKGKISVVYNGKGKYPGSFKKTVTVYTNAQDEPFRLFIEGDMEAATKEDKK